MKHAIPTPHEQDRKAAQIKAGIANAKAMKPLTDELTALSARAQMDELCALELVGFTRAEAFQLLLARAGR